MNTRPYIQIRVFPPLVQQFDVMPALRQYEEKATFELRRLAKEIRSRDFIGAILQILRFDAFLSKWRSIIILINRFPCNEIF